MVRVVKKSASLPRIKLVKKVAAYCRVSTQQEMQYNSLAAQRSYYEKMVADHPEWTLVGIYADQKSGRNNKKMVEFQQMMAECRAGKIDLIFIKSISRSGSPWLPGYIRRSRPSPGSL